MSLSINVTAPSGELSRPSDGITGSSADAITSIEVSCICGGVKFGFRPGERREHTLTRTVDRSQNRAVP
jgi:hypothetical protein